ncbi:MAG: dihydroneopterin aldolase family protein [Nitrososphaerota archaeon]|nr:dihydroneopterin aldolase family protein [Nitrososphaerales archaeon]MDW8045428.1 dihydroneopterin aldolase family protein [Nitrososphaerota archaeon]
MKEGIESIVRKYFDQSLTDRERAIFEGGIALGALYHQFIGIPICRDRKVVSMLERAIEEVMKLQPYREKVDVKIDIRKIKGRKRDPYDYEVLKGRHINAKLTVKYGKATAVVVMKYIDELDYTLMYVEKVEESP